MSKQAGREIHEFDKAIEFLEVTSTLIENLNSHQGYTSMADRRFGENERTFNMVARVGSRSRFNAGVERN